MLPSIEEAKRELDIAAQLNPGPWVKHSLNVGIAARNIAERVPELDEEKAYILNCQTDDYDRLIQICDALATDYGFVILEKRFVAVPFMMSCRISEGRHCYVRRRGSHLQINSEKV